MDKLWAGRFKSALNSAADDFNSSIRVDSRMYREDIEGSQAHVRMLASCGICLLYTSSCASAGAGFFL